MSQDRFGMDENGSESSASRPDNMALASDQPSPQPFEASTENVMTAFLTVSGTVAMAIGTVGAFPAFGIALVVLGSILPILWPDKAPSSVWSSIAGKVSAIFKQVLREYAVQEAITRAKTQLGICQGLKESLDDWLASGQIKGRDRVKNQYDAFILIYMPHMEQLVPSEYRSVLVSLYVNAGLNYLTMLREIYPYADTLDLNSRTVLSGKEDVLARFRKGVAILVDTALESYKLGLEDIVKKSISTPPVVMTWKNYNDYRTDSTIAALDFLAMYCYLDPVHYEAPVPKKYLNRRLLHLVDTTNEHSYGSSIVAIEEFEKRSMRHKLSCCWTQLY